MKKVRRIQTQKAPVKGTREDDAPAFTLMELLVTLTIISLLAALVIPAFTRAISSSRSAACAANLRQIGAACFSFAADNDGMLPAANIAGTPWPFSTYMYQLNPYLGNLPTARFEQQKIVCFGGVFRCPGKRDWNLAAASDNQHVSYGLNTFSPATVPPVGPRLVTIQSPAKTVLAADLETGYWALRNAAYMYRDFRALRHNNLDNILFCDGHVEALPKNSFTYELILP